MTDFLGRCAELAEWCKERVSEIYPRVGFDETVEGIEFVSLQPIFVDLAQRLVRIGLGEFAGSIAPTSFTNAREAIAMLEKTIRAISLEQAARQGWRDPASPESSVGFLGGKALGDALGVHHSRQDAFFRQLARKRMILGDDVWHEVHDPRPNSPKFLYHVDSPKLSELATAYRTPKPA